MAFYSDRYVCQNSLQKLDVALVAKRLTSMAPSTLYQGPRLPAVEYNPRPSHFYVGSVSNLLMVKHQLTIGFWVSIGDKPSETNHLGRYRALYLSPRSPQSYFSR